MQMSTKCLSDTGILHYIHEGSRKAPRGKFPTKLPGIFPSK